MRVGKLDRRIIIQSVSVVTDAYGDETETWATFLTVWADFYQEKGKEITDNNNRTTDRPVTFITRYHPTITKEMRILFGSTYYKIEDIFEINRQDGLKIYTSLITQT